MKGKISPRLALVIIAAFFILPLLAAWLMYSGVIDYDPANTRNLGVLVSPPEPVALDSLDFGDGNAAKLREHWVVLYALPDPCDQACLEETAALRQVHIASGRNQSRIRLLLFGETDAETGQNLQKIYPEFIRASSDGDRVASLLQDIAANHSSATKRSAYLIDPLGNIMLFYAAGFDPNDLKKDLKRLLTWSKLDEQ